MCVREMKFLARRNTNSLLIFQDIHDPGFSPESIGKTAEDLMARIHGSLDGGEVFSGVQVFREAYRRVGLGWWLAPTGWPILRLIFDWGYRVFARNRLLISRLFGERLENPEDCERCLHFGETSSPQSKLREEKEQEP